MADGKELVMTQYLVVDYDLGQTSAQLESDLNTYGASGWDLSQVDMLQQSKRRAIFTQGGATPSGGGIPEAPSDANTYGRHQANWNPVLPITGGALTGTLTLFGDPVNPTDAADKNYVDLQIADLNDVYMRWVPYTGPPQSFLNQDVTRDGDWTMVANKNTSDRPAPQQSGPEEDLLPDTWTPTLQSVRATYIMYNEWTVSTAGWIDQYGGTVLAQNTPNALHTITLAVNGVIKDTFTSSPVNAGLYLQNITPLLVPSGSVIRVTVKVNQTANNLMFWQEQAGLFATPPNNCSLAQGSYNNGALTTTAYDCHVMFIPGSYSPDWDVLAFGGAAAAGGAAAVEEAPTDGQQYGRQNAGWTLISATGGGITDAPVDGATYGRLNAAWVHVLELAGGTMTGAITLPVDPVNPLEASTKQYVDAVDNLKVAKAGDTMTGLLTLSGDPTAALGAATKQYVDGKGGLADAPSDGTTYGRLNVTWAPVLPLSGGTMTGLLTLFGDPTAALDAATKQYVDNAIAAAKTGRAFQ
jgi:hypothetical protein